MIVWPAFVPEKNEGIIWTLSRTLILLACINVLRNLHSGLVGVMILAIIIAGADWFNLALEANDMANLINVLLFAIFICLISYQVFHQVLHAKDIDFHIIIGAFCGFLLIGLLTLICCTYFHLKDPQSFSNVAPGAPGVDDLLYFSYITIITIGYGDIAPLTDPARRISLFFGLIGQFYLAVIMAVLVGKFISKTET